MESELRERRHLTLVHVNQDVTPRNATGKSKASRECYQYMADTIRQIQVLAWQVGCSKLANILEEAHREADEHRRALGKGSFWFEPM